ncbi:hypothetical protein [Tenacibaculum sp. M341]|uniref:hypothetical protein n=1 Tax=Tenacibaculum sp. M341 TaxID=2530339 RepID=UPI0010439D70|nr:hypothetical protein [Tenacibaculum sp. M341]TCI92142.1 hypothetical protein EYW44_08135 [Tenacibaculum sp. M341]
MKRLLVLVVVTTLLVSCGNTKIYNEAVSKISVAQGTVPASFIKDNQVLLVKNLGGELAQIFTKYYKGKHEFVSTKELETNDKYKDVSTYAYLFDFKESKMPEYGSFKDFFMLDRKENKVYRTGFSSTNNQMVLKAHAKKLEEIRKSDN